MPDTMNTRRTLLRGALAAAAAAATTASFLRAAADERGEARLPLKGGGTLIVRERGDQWTGKVVGPRGEEIESPTGAVVLENGETLSLEDGRVVDGAEFAGFSLFVDLTAPASTAVRRPVLRHQSELLK